MKRVFSFILALSFVVSMPFIATAAGSVAIKFSPSASTVYLGQKFDITVDATNTTGSGVAAFDMVITFDNTRLDFVSATPLAMDLSGELDVANAGNLLNIIYCDSTAFDSPIPPSASKLFKLTFVVKATASIGSSSFSAKIGAFCDKNVNPLQTSVAAGSVIVSKLATPSSVKAVSSSYNSVTISWGAVTGASGYTVYRATSSTGTYSYLSSTSSSSYLNSPLNCGTTYYYKIYAFVMSGGTKVCSNYSSSVSARPVPATPGSFSAARASSSSIKLSWSAVTGASGYTIYRSTSSSGTYSYFTSTTSTSYTNTKLTKNTTYYYKIYAYRMVNGVKVCSNYTAVKTAKPY